MKITRKILFSLAGISLVVGIVVAIITSFWIFNRINTITLERKQSFLQIISAQNVISELFEAETNQRNYLLTNDETFLKQYNVVRSAISPEVIGVLSPLIIAKLAEMDHFIELSRQKNTEEVLSLIKSDTSKNLTTLLRAEKINFIKAKETTVTEQDTLLQSTVNGLFIILSAASLLMLLLAGISIYSLHQEKANRKLQLSNKNLQLSQEKLEVTLSSIGDGVLVTDAQARVILLNPVAEILTGWSHLEALGHTVTEIFNIIDHHSRLPRIVPVMETLSKGTLQGLTNHTLLIARGGKECAIEDSCAPILSREDGHVMGAILVFRDITARRSTESDLEKASLELNILAEELQQTALVKSEFLANMSHELRTPLNSIIGFSEALFDELFGTLNEKQKKYAKNVLTSGNHLLLLINQILDMARVESGKMSLSVTLIPIGALLYEIIVLVEHMVTKKNLRMKIEIAENLPEIEADELKVKEILYNLLANAIKFTPSTGSMGIQAQQIGSEIEVIIWDTGIGIAPENMEKIFEGFFRVDTPYPQVTEGTGLGLPLSRKFVELHGGKLSVESAGLQKGTSVRFTLPIKATKVI